jgi:hypothetical protein
MLWPSKGINLYKQRHRFPGRRLFFRSGHDELTRDGDWVGDVETDQILLRRVLTAGERRRRKITRGLSSKKPFSGCIRAYMHGPSRTKLATAAGRAPLPRLGSVRAGTGKTWRLTEDSSGANPPHPTAAIVRPSVTGRKRATRCSS